jgi:YD repeat-containing protein
LVGSVAALGGLPHQSRQLRDQHEALGLVGQNTLTNRDTNVWTFAFDGANHLTNTVTPTSRATAQTWNNRGLLATVVQPSTHTTTLSYDVMDRLSTRADLVGTTTFQYDLDSNVTNVVENSVSLTSTFDTYDRAVK